MEPSTGRYPGLEPGGVVRVRSRRWLVEQVSEPTQAWESPLVRLSCVEDDALGERVEVLWDHELDARVEDTEKAWDLNEEFRRRVKTQSSLPNERAAVVLLFSLLDQGFVRLRRFDGWKRIAKVLLARARAAA